MKIGIVTIYDKNNIGNRLQNYAVQEIFRSIGCSVSTIVVLSRYKRLKRKLYMSFNKLNLNVSLRHRAARQLKIARFNKNFIDTIFVNGFSAISNIESRFDYFVVGSDQVWNSLWYFSNEHKIFLLDFTSPKKRIALSASFGIDYIPDKWKDIFRFQLLKFKTISVREYIGKRIIRELINRDVDVLIDPVLFFDTTFWRNISTLPTNIKIKSKKYLFCYYLESQGIEDPDITSYANRHNLEIISIRSDIDRAYCISPTDLLWLIDNAELVCTDSYHAYIFSFLFGRPAVYIDNTSIDMSSRVNSFIKKMEIHKNNIEDMDRDDIRRPIYSQSCIALKREHNRMLNFVLRSLN